MTNIFYESNDTITDRGYSYAAQTWSNIPKKDGRCIQIAWATLNIPDMPFNGCMTFPCELTLKTTDEGIRLFTNPVREIERLYDQTYSWKSQVLNEEAGLSCDIDGELFDMSGEFDVGSAQRIIIDIRGIELVYDVKEQKLSCMDKSIPLKPEQGKIGLRVLVDRAIIETFGNGGRVHTPIGVVTQDKNSPLKFLVEGGNAALVSLNISTMNSAWKL